MTSSSTVVANYIDSSNITTCDVPWTCTSLGDRSFIPCLYLPTSLHCWSM